MSHIVVRDSKGNKDRMTMLPQSLQDPQKDHLVGVKALHEEDRRNKVEGVYLPHALARKYPNASEEWIWQWVFLSVKLSKDPRTGIIRHGIIDTAAAFEKVLKQLQRKLVSINRFLLMH